MGDLLNLQQPLLDGGIRSVNFFNGRLLTGKDLSREQDARRASDWRLGEAIGDGVAFGLDVVEDSNAEKKLGDSPSAVLNVSAGLAINRNGQVLRLTSETNVRLVRPVQGATAEGKIFGACDGAGGRYFAGAGLYLLTIAPAEASEGKAPTNGLDLLNVRCNTDATVEGLQFRLLPVKASLYAGADPSSATFRNDLAYRCFGSAIRSAWLADPFGADLDPYGMVDDMRASGLTDCDVPLALVFMVGATAIRFIDQWAVRRAPHCHPGTPSWMPFLSPRRLAEGQAMFFQFQAHIDWLRSKATGDLGSVTAASDFSFLPPVGVIPVNREADKTDTHALKFFAGLTTRGPAFINAARLEMLVRQSVLYPPVDTASGEMLWLYRVRENAQAVDAAGDGGPRSYVVFASGHIPYAGDAQFDLARWDYANFALR